MKTVFTPDALARSKFKTCKLSELQTVDADESFLFRLSKIPNPKRKRRSS